MERDRNSESKSTKPANAVELVAVKCEAMEDSQGVAWYAYFRGKPTHEELAEQAKGVGCQDAQFDQEQDQLADACGLTRWFLGHYA